MEIAYRREIDGLRALAVLPVIFFHAGFASFRGGFVGVDVFFVISGYLITSILLAEHASGRFSMVHFWERRARRILPALFLVMLVCLPLAWVWLLPTDLMAFGRALMAVALYSSNLLFWQTSDYFAPTAELNPLLHTWSLAVEEQYYLLFPPFLALAWRWGRAFVLGVLALAALLSLAVAQRWVASDPSAAYFLLPSRGWELAVGAFLAFHLANRERWQPAPGVAEAGAVAGLCLLIGAVLLLDDHAPFPGVAALLPTLGTGLLVLFATGGTAVGRTLGSRPLVAVGLISYSAYLWHQPLFAFARQAMAAPPAPATMLGLSAVSLALGALSWRYVEAPFRDRRRFSRREVFILAAAGSVFFIACGAAAVGSGGFATRLSADQRALASYTQYDYQPVQRSFRCQLMKQQRARDFAEECFPATAAPESVLVWGDSHAAAMAFGLREKSPGLGQLTAASCPPIPDVKSAKAHCEEINHAILEWVAIHRPGVVVLHAAWSKYTDVQSPARLAKLVARVRVASPETLVVVVGGVPTWQPNLPAFLFKAGVNLDGEAARKPPQMAALRLQDSRIRAAVVPVGARFVSALNLLCPEDQCLVVVRDGAGFVPTAWDEGHLTAAGSRLLASRLMGTLAIRQTGPH